MSKLYLVITILLTFVVNPIFSIKSEANEIKPEDFKKGIVKISSNGRQGTGFIVGISPNEVYILTVIHVVEGDPNPTIKFFENQEFKAKVLFNEEELDLSLLLVKDKLPKNIIPLYLEKTFKKLEYDDKLFTFGFPSGGADWTYSNLFYSALKGSKILFSGNINEGNSGGPVIKENKVIGIITSTTTFTYARYTVMVRLFLSGIIGGDKILKNMETWKPALSILFPQKHVIPKTSTYEKWIGKWKHTEDVRMGKNIGLMELRLENANSNLLVGESDNYSGTKSFLKGTLKQSGKIFEGSWYNPNTRKKGIFLFKLKNINFFEGNYALNGKQNKIIIRRVHKR
ncbi:MAG: serine protease [Candidatus Marithrix sp.]